MMMQNNSRSWLVAGVFGVLLRGCANVGAATEVKPMAAAPATMKVEKSAQPPPAGKFGPEQERAARFNAAARPC